MSNPSSSASQNPQTATASTSGQATANLNRDQASQQQGQTPAGHTRTSLEHQRHLATAKNPVFAEGLREIPGMEKYGRDIPCEILPPGTPMKPLPPSGDNGGASSSSGRNKKKKERKEEEENKK